VKARSLSSGGTALALLALAFSIALGQPRPQQPPEPGVVAPAAIAQVINCPPTRPEVGGSDC
jgi:hypothetical protein